MLRLRLASLAFAGCLLLTMSGCCSFCEDGRLFPRLFNRTSNSGKMHGGGIDCECHHPGWHHGAGVPMGNGPFVPPPPAMVSAPNPNPSIPITNINPNPPQLFKVPNAPPTAYVPAH